MNKTIEEIITNKTKLEESYIENMKYYDIFGIDEKSWNRIQKIKKEILEKLDKEAEKINVARAATEAKIALIDEGAKNREANIKKLNDALEAKIEKINAKIRDLNGELDGIPEKRFYVKESAKNVPASLMNPDYTKYMKSKTAKIKAMYKIN